MTNTEYGTHPTYKGQLHLIPLGNGEVLDCANMFVYRRGPDGSLSMVRDYYDRPKPIEVNRPLITTGLVARILASVRRKAEARDISVTVGARA